MEKRIDPELPFFYTFTILQRRDAKFQSATNEAQKTQVASKQ